LEIALVWRTGLYVYIGVLHSILNQGGIAMNVVPVRLPDKIIEEIDKMVQEGFYSNRSGAIRIIVTRYILEETEKKRK
jgi:hypothetical protein